MTDEGDETEGVLRGRGIAVAATVGDAAGELLGVVAIGPGVGETGLLKKAGVFGKAVFERVEVLEETIDGVVPLSLVLDLADGDHALGRGEGAVGGVEILVSEDEDGLAGPIASLGDTEDVEASHAGLAPAAFEDGLGGDELGGNVDGEEGGGVDLARKGALGFGGHGQESFLMYSPLSLKSFRRRTKDVGNMG